MNVSVETQAATLRNLLRRATGHGFVRAGLVLKVGEGELVITHLTATLRTLDALVGDRTEGKQER